MMRRSLRFASPRTALLEEIRVSRAADIKSLAEVVQAEIFLNSIAKLGTSDSPLKGNPSTEKLKAFQDSTMVTSGKVSKEDFLGALDAAILTFFLHVESRTASLLGCGFYTIGPCGEELLSPIGLHLRPTDPMALHYRHLAVNLGRQVQLAGGGLPSEQVVRDIAKGRARGYTVASSDPVSGGHHCALGGSCPTDYLVTSTLASQTCPAVGRALGGSLAKLLGRENPYGKDYLSFVSLGDGSTSNGHFLSGLNLAKFAKHRQFGVPLLTCVTDNGLCISLKNKGFFQKKFVPDMGVKTFTCSATDMLDIWDTTADAAHFTRTKKEPTALIISNVTRRFGHAATDRQLAYLSPKEVQAMAANNDVLGACHQAVSAGLITADSLSQRAKQIWGIVQEEFNAAHQEPKIVHRDEVMQYTAQPIIDLPTSKTWIKQKESPSTVTSSSSKNVLAGELGTSGKHANLMRKHMNKIFDHLLGEKEAVSSSPSDVVYIGEDVTHGGYYLVTEGLLAKHGPLRIADYPPDETSLIGAGMGYAQAGLTPIVELPYAKYLDCGFDMFTEACVMNWLSKGKQPNGLIFRLQGFGRGVFGGNYHTHNQLFIPPGLDVVCYSNGRDYTSGMKYAVEQARNGRLIMFVDCTELLNLRSIAPLVPDGESEGAFTPCVGSWEFEYADSASSYRTLEDVTLYHDDKGREERPVEKKKGKGKAKKEKGQEKKKLAIIAYGGGMISALQAGHELRRQIATGTLTSKSEYSSIDIIDCPLLSAVPSGLSEIIGDYDGVLFADMCKDGQHPFASHISTLMNEKKFKDITNVKCVTAPRTYNPLGNTLTFMSAQDILDGAKQLIGA